jgi:hypothetical protein
MYANRVHKANGKPMVLANECHGEASTISQN